MAQRCKILAGYMMLNQKNDCYRFAFDHRLFADEGGYSALGKWIPLLGFIQRIYQSVQVGMITTRCYSLELCFKSLYLINTAVVRRLRGIPVEFLQNRC